MSHLKFLTFQRNLCLKVKDKLKVNLKLNNQDISVIQNNLINLNISKDLIQDELNINILQTTKQLEQIQNEIRFLNERESIHKNNINFYTNLQKYL